MFQNKFVAVCYAFFSLMERLRPVNADGSPRPADMLALKTTPEDDYRLDEMVDSPREGWRDLLARKKLQKKLLLDQQHTAASIIQVVQNLTARPGCVQVYITIVYLVNSELPKFPEYLIEVTVTYNMTLHQ